MTDSANLVIVANRLPVDRVHAPRRHHRVAPLPRRAGERARAGHARQRRHLDRLAGRHRDRPRAVRGRRAVAGPDVACRPTRSRSSTRASPTARCGRSTTTSSPSRSSTASGGTPTSPSTSASPTGPPRSPAKGATVWVHDYQLQLVPQMLRELRPDLRIGFYLHIPFPPQRALPAAAVAAPDPRGPARRRPGRLPDGRRRGQNFVRLVRQRVGHKTHRDLVYLPDGRTVRAAAFPISIDTAGVRGARPLRVRHPAGQGDPRGARQPAQDLPRRRPARLHQGHPRPAARVQRADRGRPLRRRGRRLRPGRDAVAGAGRAVPHPARRDRPAGRPDQRRPRPDRPPRDLLHALLPPARGDGRALPGRRHHGRHAATATA